MFLAYKYKSLNYACIMYQNVKQLWMFYFLGFIDVLKIISIVKLERAPIHDSLIQTWSKQ